MNRKWSRREALWLAGGLGAALAAGCGGSTDELPLPGVDSSDDADSPPSPTSTDPVRDRVQPSPTQTPTPAPKGREERLLMAGTAWETPLHIANSGATGP